MGAVFNGLSGNGMIGRPGIDIGWQPAFEKPIVGGYLTRVARRQYARVTGDPGLRALVAAQAGAAPAPVLTDRARAARWLSDLRVSYVLVRDDAVPGALRATISKTWPLTRLDAGDGFTLYAVKTGGRHARR
jgi:hypothetical protein